MPTVLRVGSYRFHFYSAENREPPHIHVARDDYEAKYWLRPVALYVNHGFNAAELRDIERLVIEHCDTLIARLTLPSMSADTIAIRCWVEGRRVWLELDDQRLVSFPAAKYPRLSDAPQELLEKALLRVQGRALRWEELDEDILVDDAVQGVSPALTPWPPDIRSH